MRRGGTHLPIADALYLTELIKKIKSEVRGRKERRKRKNNAKFSGHYVRPRTHNVRAHALRLQHNKIMIYNWLIVKLIISITTVFIPGLWDSPIISKGHIFKDDNMVVGDHAFISASWADC